MGVHVTSDLTEPWKGQVRWSLETLDGEVLEGGKQPVVAPPLASTQVSALDFSARVSDDNRRALVLVCELLQASQRVALAVATLVPDKHLTLTDPGLTVDVHQEGDQVVFAVKARSLARFVELSLVGLDVVFSDNFFDVPAGRTVTVTCPVPLGRTVEQAREALRVHSLYDSFA
jgi:beta-mannosidase